jgi:hypothetical protein
MGEWIKLHSEELHKLYCSPDTIRPIKARRMRSAGRVARMVEERKLRKLWWESLKERAHLEHQGVDGRMGSEWTLDICWWGWGVEEWIQFSQDRDQWRAVVNAAMNL